MARTLLIVLATAVLSAVPAAAAPVCTNTAPNTRVCVNPGHTAITTTPNPAFTDRGWGFGWGTPVFGLGSGGFWIGL